MVSERRRAPLGEGILAFEPPSVGACVRFPEGEASASARLARAFVELAAARAGAVVLVATLPEVGAALRGAREIGVEPRVLAPAGQPGLPLRTPLTIALQGEPASSAFARAAEFVAGFVASRASLKGKGPDGALRAKVLASVQAARGRSAAGVDFASIAAEARRALGPSSPAGAKVAAAFEELRGAEEAARAFTYPVSWDPLLAPSPSGRRAAVMVDLSQVEAGAAPAVGALAMASLAASLEPGEQGAERGPLFFLGPLPSGPLGRFAAKQLAGAAPPGSPPTFALFVAGRDGGEPSDWPAVSFAGEALEVPGGERPLPLPPLAAGPAPLSADEVRALSPPALRARLLGKAGAEEEAPEPALDAGASAAESARSFRALHDAAGDLEALARRRAKPAAGKAQGGAPYEAGDFDLK